MESPILHMFTLWARENYIEKTLVASISSLVSDKCDLKGKRMKGEQTICDNCKQEKALHHRTQVSIVHEVNMCMDVSDAVKDDILCFCKHTSDVLWVLSSE